MANPRYTGRQVWNRQQTHRRPTDDLVPGLAGIRKLTASPEWAISDKPAHEALVSERDFVAAQHIGAKCQPVDGAGRTHLLAGLLRCGTCRRSMDSQLSHGNRAYRCRHGHTSAHPAAMRQAPNLYLREDVILGRIFAHLHSLTSQDAGVRAEITELHQRETTIPRQRIQQHAQKQDIQP